MPTLSRVDLRSTNGTFLVTTAHGGQYTLVATKKRPGSRPNVNGVVILSGGSGFIWPPIQCIINADDSYPPKPQDANKPILQVGERLFIGGSGTRWDGCCSSEIRLIRDITGLSEEQVAELAAEDRATVRTQNWREAPPVAYRPIIPR